MRCAQDCSGPGPGSASLPTLPWGPHPGPEPTLPPEAVWPISGFPLHRTCSPRLFHLCLHLTGEETKGAQPLGPVRSQVFLSEGSPPSLEGTESRHSPGPPRLSKGSEVGESVPWARLGRGSNSTWKNVQPKVEPSSAAGNRCTEAFADWINAFPHKERESKIHVDPLALLMKRRQGCRGGGSQAAGKEAFLHRTFPAYAVHLRYLHCPVVL